LDVPDGRRRVAGVEALEQVPHVPATPDEDPAPVDEVADERGALDLASRVGELPDTEPDRMPVRRGAADGCRYRQAIQVRRAELVGPPQRWMIDMQLGVLRGLECDLPLFVGAKGDDLGDRDRWIPLLADSGHDGRRDGLIG